MLNDTNAMTEVALALAMAFFAVLVLALVSMGVPTMNVKSPQVSTVVVSATQGSREIQANEVLVIFFESRLYNDQLTKLNELPATGKLIVAVPGTASLQDLLELQSRFVNRAFSITSLDPAWRARLEDLHSNR